MRHISIFRKVLIVVENLLPMQDLEESKQVIAQVLKSVRMKNCLKCEPFSYKAQYLIEDLKSRLEKKGFQVQEIIQIRGEEDIFCVSCTALVKYKFFDERYPLQESEASRDMLVTLGLTKELSEKYTLPGLYTQQQDSPKKINDYLPMSRLEKNMEDKVCSNCHQGRIQVRDSGFYKCPICFYRGFFHSDS